MEVSVRGAATALNSRKTRALLAYLVVRREAPAPREVLTGLLWGDRGEAQARASLRQALAELRRALGPAGVAVQAGREFVSFTVDSVSSDVAAFEAAAASDKLEELETAAGLYRGELLEGFTVDEPAFDQWLAGERERMRLLAASAFSRLMDQAEGETRTDQAIGWALKLLTLDPLQEHVHRRLMRLYAAQGRADAALAQYELCQRVLTDQLGVRPEPATEELASELRARRRRPSAVERGATKEQPPPAQRGEPPPLPSRPSIAVLCFHSIGTGESYFAEGVTEDIITDLSRNKELFVVARQSSFCYGTEPGNPEEIGRELGVRYLLNGSIRRAGARLRLSVHLTDAVVGREVWAEHYDREIADIFDLQDEIARTVSATAFGRIVDHGAAVSHARRPSDLSAYDHVLRGMQHMHRYTAEDYEKAGGHFERAIAIDPDWARPYGYLCLIGVYRWFWDMSRQGLSQVLEMGEKALSLDGHDARSQLALGVARLFSRDHDRAIHHLERAMSLNPNDDLIACEHGRLLLYLDRPEDGLLRVREAMRLNPFHPNWYWNIYGRCLHTAGRYEEAIEAFNRIESRQFWGLAYLAACHAMLGEHERSADYARRTMEARPDFNLDIFKRALPYRSEQILHRFLDTFRMAGLY